MGSMRESMDDQTFEDINCVFEQMDELHPDNDHWYLPLTGVDPVAQGRGLGTLLLRHGLKTCDSDELPDYLEATSPRNRNLYARHGFNIVEIIQAGTSPPLWAMLQEPTSQNPRTPLLHSMQTTVRIAVRKVLVRAERAEPRSLRRSKQDQQANLGGPGPRPISKSRREDAGARTNRSDCIIAEAIAGGKPAQRSKRSSDRMG